MSDNSTTILFLSTLISGVLILLWMWAWMSLEINSLCFIPLFSSYKNMFFTEAILKYFRIQAMAS